MDALDLVESELIAIKEYNDIHRVQTAGATKDNIPQRKSNPLLLGESPYKYMILKMRQVKAPDLEQAMFTLPFSYVCRLLNMILKVCL